MTQTVDGLKYQFSYPSFTTTKRCGIETDPYAIIAGHLSIGAIGANNRGFFQPVFISEPITVSVMRIRIDVQAGNIDVGIYNQNGRLLVSTGSFACPAAGFAEISITKTILFPGLHYFAIAGSDTTLALYSTPAITAGILKTGFAAGFPLPATLPVLAETGSQRYWMEAC